MLGDILLLNIVRIGWCIRGIYDGESQEEHRRYDTLVENGVMAMAKLVFHTHFVSFAIYNINKLFR